MACRRAFDLDLVACLLDPERPEWVAFREHYPLCADCAAEVRTWTELQGGLASPHPSPEALVQLEGNGHGLAPELRTQIAAHLADCASCRDEVRALRAFDAAALAATAEPAPRPAPVAEPSAPAPIVAEPPAPRRRRRPWIVRLVVHPAFAYAVALAVALPALEPRLRPLLRKIASATRTTAPQTPAPRSQRVAPMPGDVAPATFAPAAAPAPTTQAEEQPGAERRTEPLRAAPARLAGEPPAAAGALADAVRRRESDEAAAGEAVAAPWPVVTLSPSRETVLRAPSGGGIVLRLAPPRSQPAVPATLAALRVRDAAGRREIAEQQLGAPGSVAEIHVPAGWLEPGGYRAELVLGDDSRPAVTAALRIEP